MSGPSASDRPKFFGRRRGRPLKPSQEAILERRLPDLSLDPDALPSDVRSLFSSPVGDVWMEVGFGSGEHLVAQASAHSSVGFIGCEPFINGVAKLVRDADAAGVRNLRIYPDDARHIVAQLPDACLGKIFVLFPDPWPKKRHYSRRFVGPENLPNLSRVLRPDGELRCATDHAGYLDWMLFHIAASGAFDWMAQRPSDWRCRPADQPATRYEQKTLAGQPHYLCFRRR